MSRNQTLRHGSVISQLENDQYNESEGDQLRRAYARGWNKAVRRILAAVRAGDAISRAFGRGYNHGTRHALDVIRMGAALAELAHAPVIETVNPPFVELHTDGPGGEP